jgi:hypothetical protein
MGSATYHKQMLVFGQDKNTLYLVRVSADGYQEHYGWHYYPAPGEDTPEVYPFFPQNISSDNDIALPLRTLEKILSFDNKDLPANRHFNEELHIRVKNELEEDVLCFVFDYGTCTLITITVSPDKSRMNINHYLHEDLLSSKQCKLNGTHLEPQSLHFMQQMIYRDKYYFHMNRSVYRVDDMGQCEELLALDADIFSLSNTPGNKIIARTKEGSILIGIGAEMKIIGDFFAATMLCVAKAYIPDDLFVLAAENYAEVYDIKYRPILISTIHSADPIKEILSTGEKNQLVILDNKGVMTIHTISV